MIPTTPGNNIEDYTKRAYFTEVNRNRTMVLVLDLQRTDMIPAITEPLFQEYEADVEIHPAMNLNDLKKAVSSMQG
jgi:hypothetical protein